MTEQKRELDMKTAAVDRDKVIIRTSYIGILANIFLAGFKAAIGVLSNSIAVILDAVNNLSDALSSVITIAGTKLAGKAPDKKHPLGYGRIEYLSAAIVSALVLYAGITSLMESVKKIIHPETPDYSMVSLIIIASAVIVKLILGKYVKSQGEKVKSGALVASGSDAMFDAILSASVLASALIFVFTGVSLEAWVGTVISAFIIKAGIEMLRDTLDDILGRRADSELTKHIKEHILEFPEVRGAYDLFINNYGPNRDYASIHIELPDTMTVEQVDVLTRKIQTTIYKETGVILTGIGVYSYNTTNDEATAIRNDVQDTIMKHDWVLQMHGFYADTNEKKIRFDVVLSFEIPTKEALATLNKELKEKYPDYEMQIAPDIDISDI